VEYGKWMASQVLFTIKGVEDDLFKNDHAGGKQMKKTFMWSMCIMLFASLVLSACSNNAKPSSSGTASEQPSSSAPASEPTEETAADPFGKFDPPVKITTVRAIDAAMKLPAGQTYEDNVWTQAYADELGIDVDVLWTADVGQYESKLSMSIASGDLPDIMKVDAKQFKQLVESDSLADLSEVFEKYASEETKKQFGIGDSIALKSGMIGDKLFALPNTASAIGGAAGPLIWIRSDWMKELNLPEPQTMQDVLAIARAFAADDPDHNGEKDTYGFSFEKGFLTSGFGNTGFFNAYHAYPRLWLEDASGQLVYGSVQPEMKNALQDLQSLYKDGAIDPEFIVKDGGKTIEAIVAGKVGIINGPHYFGQFIHQLKVRDPNSDWTPYALPSIDSEPAKVSLQSPTLELYVVRKGVSNPEAIVKMFNFVFKMTVGEEATKEKYDQYMYDPQDGTIQLWKFSPVFSNDATDALFQQMIDAVEANDANLATDMTARLIYDNMQKALNGEHALYGWSLYYPAWKIFYDIMDKGLYVNTGFYGAPTETMSDKSATLDQLEMETFSKIIMGVASIDEFDKFVDNWRKLGGDQITQEVNEWREANK